MNSTREQSLLVELWAAACGRPNAVAADRQSRIDCMSGGSAPTLPSGRAG